jgi:hypothetical protein
VAGILLFIREIQASQRRHRGPLYVEKKRRHLESWGSFIRGVTETADVVPIAGRRA